ncbi:MAG: hypothetical protein WKF58_13265 [Ilumatobacteraceae bacterium]
MIAVALSRYTFKGSSWASTSFSCLPLTTPEIVLGSSLATLFLDCGRGLAVSPP